MTTTRDRQRANRIAIALLPAVIAAAMYLAAGTSAQATDCYFTCTNAYPDSYYVYFTDAANWSPSVPGPTDTAIFTNNAWQFLRPATATVITNANVYFNRSSGTELRLDFQPATYWVITNSLIIGQTAGSDNNVWQLNGTLAVTNADGTARMIVGQAGQGRHTLSGGAVIVDHLYVTNAASYFYLSTDGNLTIRGDSTIKYLNFDGSCYGTTSTSLWNVIGGTTTVLNDEIVGQRDMMILTVSGTNTVVNFQGKLLIGHAPETTGTNGNSVIVTNGAVINVSNTAYVGYDAGTYIPDNNLLVVTGSNSLCNTTSLIIGNEGLCTNNRVRVENGGCLTNSGAISIGHSAGTLGGGHQLVMGSDGRVFTASLDLQDNALTNTLKFVATPGSTNLGVVNVGGAMTIANAATAKLVVDMSQYTAFRAGITSVVLVTYGTMPTKFSAGNIVVTPPPMSSPIMRITATVDQATDNRIQVNLRVPSGTVFSVR